MVSSASAHTRLIMSTRKTVHHALKSSSAHSSSAPSQSSYVHCHLHIDHHQAHAFTSISPNSSFQHVQNQRRPFASTSNSNTNNKNTNSLNPNSTDPFEILGLSPKATPAEIKTRYRELAKKYHPDLNADDPKCADKMSKVTDAYDLLTDSKRRRIYDAQRAEAERAMGGGTPGPSGSANNQSMHSGAAGATGGPANAAFTNAHEWMDGSQLYSEFNNIFGRMASRNQRTSGGPQPQRGDDATVDLAVSFAEAMRGVKKRMTLRLKQNCRPCGGSGARPGTTWEKCKLCQGTGVRRVERGIMSMGLPCAKCNGVGELLEHPCQPCGGEGIVAEKAEVTLDVPSGIKTGMELRVPGGGHCGTRGGKRGHLFVSVKVQVHPVFRHIDDDIHADVAITLKQMLLGGRVRVPTLDSSGDEASSSSSGDAASNDEQPKKKKGAILELRGPIYPGTSRILKGRGPARVRGNGCGNLVVHFRLALPEQLTQKQVSLIEEFDAIGKRRAQDCPGASPKSSSNTHSNTATAAGAAAESQAAGSPS